MIVIRVKQGLGNQMFQYAIYRRLKAEGRDVKLDLSWCVEPDRPYLIGKVFGVEVDSASYIEARKAGSFSKYRSMRLIDRFMRLKNVIQPDNPFLYEQALEAEFESGKDLFLNGYWQNARWFEHIEDIIQEDFDFKRPLDGEALKILESIEESVSVGIHVRWYTREGFNNWQKDMEYYETAISYLMERMEGICFYVFSDNIKWCYENFKRPNITFVDSTNFSNMERDMRLLSYCNNTIISNSTYSWWGAYLNPRQIQKTVIAPKVWMKEYAPYNPNLSEWVELDE